MRVLLVTPANLLPFSLTQVLNHELEYCAIVVDEPDVAKKFLANVPPLREIIRPLYELKDCIENYFFNVAILIPKTPTSKDGNSLYNAAVNAGLPPYISVELPVANLVGSLLIKRALEYYSLHTAEFEIFSTGLSYVEDGLDAKHFKYKLFNFAHAAQDLYYDYKIAQYVSLQNAQGGGQLKYCLIGLAPYSFHYDESKVQGTNYNIFQYFLAFNDIHNFCMSLENYSCLFNRDLFNLKLPFDSEISRIISLNETIRYIDFDSKLHTRDSAENWSNKYYPETKTENVQILDDYLTLCEKNNVRPIMFLPPFTEGYKKYFSRKKLEEFYYLVSQATKKHSSALFLDGWKLPSFSDDLFKDQEHLNIAGAKRFSTIFNDIIEEIDICSD